MYSDIVQTYRCPFKIKVLKSR